MSYHKIVRCDKCEKTQIFTEKEDGWYMLGFLSRWKNGSWWIPEFPDYWMTIEPPKEEK